MILSDDEAMMMVKNNVDEIAFFVNKKAVASIDVRKILEKHFNAEDDLKLRIKNLKYAFEQES